MIENKIIVLGGNGMLGHMVAVFLSKQYDVLCILRENPIIDVPFHIHDYKNYKDLIALIESFNPAAIINTTGILVAESSLNPELTIRINSLLPKLLERQFRHTHTKIIQISTDCVFDGEDGPYSIFNLPNANDLYGISKFMGELDNQKDLTIRTSIVGPNVGENNSGLFDWFSLNEQNFEGFVNVFWSGITTLELAKFIENHLFDETTGTVMISNGIVISKHKLLTLFNEVFFSGEKNISEILTKKSNKGFVITNNDSLINKSYYQMLRELKNWMNNHSFYQHYSFYKKN